MALVDSLAILPKSGPLCSWDSAVGYLIRFSPAGLFWDKKKWAEEVLSWASECNSLFHQSLKLLPMLLPLSCLQPACPFHSRHLLSTTSSSGHYSDNQLHTGSNHLLSNRIHWTLTLISTFYLRACLLPESGFLSCPGNPEAQGG